MKESLPFSDEQIAQLKLFIESCKLQPNVLHHPKLTFFKSYLLSLRAQLPKQEETKESEPAPVSESEESEGSDLELDTTNVIEPDTDEPQPMGDVDAEPTEEQIDQSIEKRSAAMSEYRAKNYDKAIQLYTESIELDPTSPISFAKRAQVYIALKKPNACIRDCERALEINPDSALAHKMRGRANQLLGNWEDAARDLRVAVKSDFDEEANEWLNEITPTVFNNLATTRHCSSILDILNNNENNHDKNNNSYIKSEVYQQKVHNISVGGCKLMYSICKFLRDS
ncbi:putative protein FAM10A4 [Copidosoma floridanum]|uniref:putative protein FAM10A4 n=1 Tax=Copidosoma floridanum TaxID=29053 RepID=UPI0006C9D725|nr:putative protein FAM10A4 [Copidosoma floridanum]